MRTSGGIWATRKKITFGTANFSIISGGQISLVKIWPFIWCSCRLVPPPSCHGSRTALTKAQVDGINSLTQTRSLINDRLNFISTLEKFGKLINMIDRKFILPLSLSLFFANQKISILYNHQNQPFLKWMFSYFLKLHIQKKCVYIIFICSSLK